MQRISYPPDYAINETSMFEFMRKDLIKQNKNIGHVFFNHLCQDSDINDVLLQIEQSKTKIFILDGSVDDYSVNFYNEQEKIFSNAGINFIMLTGNAHYLNHKHDKIFYYPHFWRRTQMYTRCLDEPLSGQKKYIFSSLNGIARLHRILLASYLLKKPYLNQCCFTFNHYGGGDRQRPVWENIDSWWHTGEFRTTQDRILLAHANKWLPHYHPEIDDYRWDDHSNKNAAYSDTYVNIITETNVRELFFSEKTFKPLASGQFFISLNAPGSIKLIKSFGFDTFDDIINHSYDNIIDPWEKVEAISQLLDQLVDLDWPTVWASTKDRRQKNVQHFFSDAYKKLTEPFESFMEKI